MNKKRIILTLIILFSFVIPFLDIGSYNLHLVSYSLIWVILAQGLNVIQGFTGYVSIAQAGFFGIGAYSSAILSLNLGISVWLTIPLAIVISGIFGILIGYPALRTQGHYFAIVTMSFTMIIWVFMMSSVKFTGGEEGIPNIPSPSSVFGIDFSLKENYYYLILISVLITILFIYRLMQSRVGRAFITIRENEQLAQAVGISLLKYKMLSFTISAMLGGFAGALYVHYTHFVNPTPFTVDYSLNAILAVILGGSGTIIGPIIGAFIMIFLPEYLRIAEEYRLIIYAVMLILIVFYMPKGITNLIKIAYNKVLSKVARKSETKK